MESDGWGQVVSTPKATMLDNQTASISQGAKIPYLSTSAGGSNVQYINAALELEVTPHITTDNKVFMKVGIENNRADFSVCTTWGVFYRDNDNGEPVANLILLDCFKARMEFPELKAKAFETYKEWEPDAFIVEAKAAGAPLVYELRQMGIPVSEFTPVRGNDKIVRLNSVSDLFASGKVWAPPTRWAEEVMEEMAAFPNSEHDDLVDSSTQALIRFRKGGFLRLQSDEPDDTVYFKSKRRNAYY